MKKPLYIPVMMSGEVESFVESITPTDGSNVIVNGNFSAWTGGNPDGFNVTESAPDREITEVDPANAHGGGGNGALNLYASNAGTLQAVPASAPLVAGKFYRYSVDLTKLTSGLVLPGGENVPFQTIWGHEATKAYTVFITGTDGNAVNLVIKQYATPTDITIDNLSMLPLSDISSGKISGAKDFIIRANITLTAGESIGFLLNCDQYPNPTNCAMFLLTAQPNYNSGLYTYYIRIVKCVNGVWSLVSTSLAVSFTYVANKEIFISKLGTRYCAAFNHNVGSAVYSATISDASIVNNTIHAQVSTHADNAFASPTHISSVGKKSILGVGDSKTGGNGGTDPYGAFFQYLTTGVEAPVRISFGGYNTTQLLAVITGAASALTYRTIADPDFIVLNIGVADAISGTAQATFETAYGSVLDTLNTKYTTTPILCVKPWTQGYDAACDAVAGYIDNVLASRSAFASSPVSLDERVYLKGDDDGATYTADGIHPNDAGYAAQASILDALFSA